MYATEYVQQRAAFGKTIADFQGIQWEIAKCAVDIEAARLLTYRAAVARGPGQVHQGVRAVPVRWPSTTPPNWPCAPRGSPSSCSGAAGYMEDHPTEQWYRDAEQLTIVEGTSPGAAGPDRPGRPRPGPVVGLSWPEILARLSRRESLTAEEAEDALGVVLAGDATPAQVGAFLTLLHAKGETAEEVTGLARAMVDAAVPCPLDPGRGRRGRTGPRRGRPGGHRGRPAGEHQRDHAGRLHHRGLRRARVQAREPCRRPRRWGRPTCSRHWGWPLRSAPRASPAACRRRAWGSASPSASTPPCASSDPCARSSVCRPSSTSWGRSPTRRAPGTNSSV